MDLTTIPAGIQRLIRGELALVKIANAEIRRCRALETRLGAPGRYEWEYRTAHEHAALDAERRLDELGAMALAQGIDPEQLFAALGEREPLEPWSNAAHAWRGEGA